MKLWIPRNLTQIREHLRDPLFKNAYFLMFSSLTSAGSGFFFWLIAARFYSAEEVGLASAIIAAMGIISMFSLLGFDVSLVRYLPEREGKNDLINTCFTISLIFALLLTLVFLSGLEIWTPALSILKDNRLLLFLFIIFTVISPLGGLQRQGLYVGLREAKYTFIHSTVTLARIGVVPLLTAFGALGIYFSYGLTPLLAVVVGVFLTKRIYSYKPMPTIKKEVVKDVFLFSSGNYFARIFEKLPGFVLPIIVINIVGAEMNAYFYIAWQISLLLLAIPRFTSMSLLAEGSHNNIDFSFNVKRATKFIILALGLTIIVILLFGKYILWIFGEEYSKNSYNILVILALGGFPFALNNIYATIERIQKRMKHLVVIYGTIAVITIIGTYLLLPKIGIIGVGIAWVIGNTTVAVKTASRVFTYSR